MKHQWKNLENTRRSPTKHQLFSQWLFDKEKRSSIVWIGSATGVIFLLAYQMTLGVGFTPQVNLAEGAFVLAKAAIVGVLFFSAMYVAVFAPAVTHRILGIRVDKAEPTDQRVALRRLARRSACSQIFGGLFPAALFLFANANAGHHMWMALSFAIVSVVCLIVALATPRLANERQYMFILSIFATGIFALWSLSLFVVIGNLKDDLGSMMMLTGAWLVLTLFSGALSTVRGKELLPAIAVTLVLLIYILGSLGQLNWTFRAIARTVGIAHRDAVTLVLPPAACKPLQSAVSELRLLNCAGEDSGVLRNVEVLNSWGSRWLIKITKGERTRTLSFDGTGTIISLDVKESAHDRKAEETSQASGVPNESE